MEIRLKPSVHCLSLTTYFWNLRDEWVYVCKYEHLVARATTNNLKYLSTNIKTASAEVQNQICILVSMLYLHMYMSNVFQIITRYLVYRLLGFV